MKKYYCFFFCLFFIKISFALKPDSTYINIPSDFGIPFKELVLNTTDNAKINTWIFEPNVSDSNTKNIIIVNSDAGNMSYNITYAAYLHYRGYRVIMFDYRGFGKSSPFKIDSLNFYYSEFEIDLMTVTKYVSKSYLNKPNILAFSFGTIVTLNLQNIDTSLFNKYIFDGLVSNPNELITRVQKIKNKKLNTYSFAKTINNIKDKNALIFVGVEDKFTTLNDATTFLKLNKNSELIIHSGNHLESAIKLNAKYFDYINAFLNN